MRLPAPLRFSVVATMFLLVTTARPRVAGAQPGCSEASTATVALYRARHDEALRALRAATGAAEAAEAAFARWDALYALYFATRQTCEAPSPERIELRRALLGTNDTEAAVALRGASADCADVARRFHVMGLALQQCVRDATHFGGPAWWPPTPRADRTVFVEGSSQASADAWNAARSSLDAQRAQVQLGALGEETLRSIRLTVAAMAAAVGDAQTVFDTLSTLGADPEATALRAEVEAVVGDGQSAIRRLRTGVLVAPRSAALHLALAVTIHFFARRDVASPTARLIDGLAPTDWMPLAYDHARIALCVAPDDATDAWLGGAVAMVRALQETLRGVDAWVTNPTAPAPPSPLPVEYLGRPGHRDAPPVAAYEETCERLLRRRNIRATAREPWTAPR